MQTAIAIALFGALTLFPRFDWNEFDRRARKARTPEAVAALEKEIPKEDAEHAFERTAAFRSVVAAWQRVRRPDEAVRLVEVWRKDVGPLTPRGCDTYEALEAEEAYSDALVYAGRVDDAMVAARRILDVARDPECLILVEDGPNWLGVGCELLARLHERRGEYAEALRRYEAWRGSSYWFRRTELVMRGTCIARCRWKLGEADAALDIAFDAAMRPHQLAIQDDPFVWVCEIAVRTGNMTTLRRRIDVVTDLDKRARFERSFAVASAFARRDAKALLDALTPLPGAPDIVRLVLPEEAVFVVKYLREMGPDALGELLARVRNGDVPAIKVATRSALTEALPALRARRAAAGITKDEATRLDDAIDEIESAVPPR